MKPKGKLINYGGFIEPLFEREAYFLGSSPVPKKVLQPNGDWTDSLPVGEHQNKRGIETSNCTAFGATDEIEQYEFKAFGEKNEYSDRWVGIISGTTSRGNDPQKVYEAIRKYGLIPEEMLPFSDDIQTVEEYYSFKGADKDACYREGQRWLERKDFKHEWVFDPSQPWEEKLNNIKVALKYSPLAVAVSAWTQDNRGVYVRFGVDNHWTTLYKFEDYEHFKDSYEPFIKLGDMELRYCKRIHIEKKSTPEQKKSWLDALTQFFKAFLSPKESEEVIKQITPVLAPETDPKRDLLDEFCKAIQDYEGYFSPSTKYPKGSRSWRNHNPGNIKCLPVKNARAKGIDTLGFCTFQDYDTGYMALKVMIANACSGKSKVYSPEMTILQFFEKYAPTGDNNKPNLYAKFVADKLKVGTDYQIKNLVK